MNKKLKAEILLIFVAVIWGLTFVPTAAAISKISVFAFLFWRFLIAGFLMFVACKFMKFDKISIFYGLFLGLWLFLGFATQTYALKYTLTSSVAFITGLNVIVVPFIVFFFFKKKIGIFSILGAIFALSGLYFLSGAKFDSFGLGEILAVLCAIFYAFHIVFTGNLVSKGNIFTIVCFQFFAVALLSLVASFFADKISPNLIFGVEYDFSPQVIFAILITSIFATILAFFAQSYAQMHTSATKTVLIFMLEPVSAGILGYFWANEILTLYQIFGAFLILCGVLISEIGGILKDKKDENSN